MLALVVYGKVLDLMLSTAFANALTKKSLPSNFENIIFIILFLRNLYFEGITKKRYCTFLTEKNLRQNKVGHSQKLLTNFLRSFLK